MIALLSPVALAGLAALALPIVIHLRQQPVDAVVDFAALRWLRSPPLPHARWRWHDRWLLLLRLVLIATTVVLLAQPVWRAAEVAGAPWVVVSPEVPLAAARAAVVAPGAQWRWLAPGWPAVDTARPVARSAAGISAPPANRSAAWASLLRDLDDTLPTATGLTVVVPDRLLASDPVTPQLHRRVAWRPVAMGSQLPAAMTAPGMATQDPAGDGQPPRNQLAGGDPAHEGPVQATTPRLTVAFRTAEDPADELTVARALVRAWHAGAPALGWEVAPDDAEAQAGGLAQPIDPGTAVAFWLGGAPSAALAAWVAGGGTAVVPRHACPAGRPIRVDAAEGTEGPGFVEEAHGRGRLICLATPLTLQATPLLGDPGVPAALLAAILAGRDRPAPLLADAALLTPREAPEPMPPWHGRPLDTPFAVSIAVLFLAERWWATWRGSRAADPTPLSADAATAEPVGKQRGRRWGAVGRTTRSAVRE